MVSVGLEVPLGQKAKGNQMITNMEVPTPEVDLDGQIRPKPPLDPERRRRRRRVLSDQMAVVHLISQAWPLQDVVAVLGVEASGAGTLAGVVDLPARVLGKCVALVLEQNFVGNGGGERKDCEGEDD